MPALLFHSQRQSAFTLCAPVAQLAEATDSKPVQCEFESHQGHKEKNLGPFLLIRFEVLLMLQPFSSISV